MEAAKIERLKEQCRQGDTKAAMMLAQESKRRQCFDLFQVAWAGFLLAPQDDPRKQGYAYMLTTHTTNSYLGGMWGSYMWKSLENLA